MGSHRRIQGEFYSKGIIPTPGLTSGYAHPLYPLVRFKMAYEHVYGIRLDEREAEGYVRQKAAIQQLLRSSPIRYVRGTNPARGCLITNGHSSKQPRSWRPIQLRSP